MVVGVRGHGWMDGGVGRWRGDSPQEREREGEWGLLERTSRTTKLTCSSFLGCHEGSALIRHVTTYSGAASLSRGH